MSTIYTVGHSTRTVEEFIGLLKCFGIEFVADIRTVPKSRHNPQFHVDQLAGSLAELRIIADLEGVDQMGFEPERLPDPAHR